MYWKLINALYNLQWIISPYFSRSVKITNKLHLAITFFSKSSSYCIFTAFLYVTCNCLLWFADIITCFAVSERWWVSAGSESNAHSSTTVIATLGPRGPSTIPTINCLNEKERPRVTSCRKIWRYALYFNFYRVIQSKLRSMNK